MSILKKLPTVTAALIASVVVMGSGAASAAGEDERWFNLVNEADLAISEVYVATNFQSTWGPNLLRGDELMPANYVELDPLGHNGECEFDVLLVYEDGRESVIEDVNFCEYIDLYTDGYEYQLSV